MNKSETFKKELNYIKNEKIRNSTKTIIELLPDYFFEIPASSTGKYHPEFTTGPSGLVRHVKAAVRIFYELLNNPIFKEKYTDNEIDIMLMALILHDGLKSGKTHNKYTCVDHPTLIKNLCNENASNLELTPSELNLLTSCLESHMGPWNKDYDNKEILPIPKTKYEKMVHMCDYLASKKFLNIKFDNDNNIIE